jgi:hypothetical protein
MGVGPTLKGGAPKVVKRDVGFDFDLEWGNESTEFFRLNANPTYETLSTCRMAGKELSLSRD